MQSFAALLSVLALFSSNAFAHPTPEAIASPVRRDTVGCYNGGHSTSRASLTSAIDNFCDEVHAGGGLLRNEAAERTYEFSQGHRVIVSAHPKSCSAIDSTLNCKNILRRPVDECNTSSTEGKQGGTVDADCATWQVDPEW